MIKGRSNKLAVIGLIAANAVPFFGVAKLGWNVSSILVVYWIESVIIGVLNVPRIFATHGSFARKLSTSAFFAVHFGMFCLGHAVFLNGIFEAGPAFAELAQAGPLLWTALGFVLSHTVSLLIRLSRGEFADKRPNDQLMAPYGRVVIMHITVLLGGFGAMYFGAPIGALGVLIILKTVIDLRAHHRETQRAITL